MIHRHVAPEQIALARALDGRDDIAQETEIHWPNAVALDPLRRLAASELERFIGAEVHVPAREERIDLGEPVADERHRTRLVGGQHMSMRSLAQRRIELVLEHVVQVPERFLLWNDVDVIPSRIRHELGDVRARQRAAWRCDQRMFRERERVLEVRRIDIDLVRRERTHLPLHELQRRNGPTRKIVVESTVSHGRPIADLRHTQARARATSADQLLHRLCTIEHARAGRANDSERIAVGNERVSFGSHRGVEAERCAAEQRTRRGRGRSQKHHARACRALRRDRNSSLVQCIAKVPRGVGIGRIRWNDDVDSARQDNDGSRGRLPRRWHEGQGSLRARGARCHEHECASQQNDAIDTIDGHDLIKRKVWRAR